MNTKYQIYNASAGSGKTFTLAIKYLEKLLGPSDDEGFKKILVLTFTNKACDEMKERILNSLKRFSDKDVEGPSLEMFNQLKRSLNLSDADLYKRSKKRLELILHNYSFFEISTIDSFSHRIIKSFAKDLNMVSDFEVVLNPEPIISQSVDNLIENLDVKEIIAKTIVDFANQKMKDGKSWDVSFDIKELSKLLTNEDHYVKIKKFKKKDVKWFLKLKKEITQKIKKLEKNVELEAKNCKKIINNIDSNVKFYRNSFPNFIKKVLIKDFKKIDLEKVKNLFLKKTIFNKQNVLEEQLKTNLVDSFFFRFKIIEANIYQWKVLNAFLYSIVPMSVLNEIREISKHLQYERKEISVSDFNTIINEEIKNHPAPYVFEKTGNRYKHFLIDEFQDTSTMQWNNLIPLISHSLESVELDGSTGSLTVLADPKQSLYRWRGANPNNFLSLLKNENPFNIEKKVFELPKNFRSLGDIVKFNNKFFKYVSNNLKFDNNKKIYKLSSQKQNSSEGGYVSIQFLKKEDSIKPENNLFLQKCLQIIQDCLNRNARLEDMCILVRNKVQQNLLAEFLISNKIPVISSESLLLINSGKVKTLIEAIRLRVDPNSKVAKKNILDNLIKSKPVLDVFNFYKKSIDKNIDEFFEEIFNLSYKDFIELELFDALSSLLRINRQTISYDAHIQFFMDEVFEFFVKKKGNDEDFLNYFDQNYESLSVVSSSNTDAVTILTIHKSKGLEFPIIIYPFADSKAHVSSQKKIWFPLELADNNIELLLPQSNDLQKTGILGKEYIKKLKEEEELDNVNLLYVAFTRAIAELYVISTYTERNSFESHNEIISSFIASCGFEFEKNLSFSWGNPLKRKIKSQKHSKSKSINCSSFNQYHTLKTSRDYIDKKVSYGKCLHELMSRVDYSYQFKKELQAYLSLKYFDKKTTNQLTINSKKILNNKILKKYYSNEFEVFCEKEIFRLGNQIIIPDRIVRSKDNVYTIIEYKTGKKRISDNKQIEKYKLAMHEMGLKVEKALLVYTGEPLEVMEI